MAAAFASINTARAIVIIETRVAEMKVVGNSMNNLGNSWDALQANAGRLVKIPENVALVNALDCFSIGVSIRVVFV
jgi:hypothetical protein